MVLLNCGASTYVPDLAPLSAANVRYIVIDSHRPVDVRYNNEGDTWVELTWLWRGVLWWQG